MKYPVSLFLALLVSSCSKDLVPNKYQCKETKIYAQDLADDNLWDKILPYKEVLDKEMNAVLGISDTILTKSIPESDLGNFMCDLMLKKSQDYFGQKVDFTFLNNGGIRIPNLPKGNVTLGKIIDLMSFENRIVIMRLKGRLLIDCLTICNQRGWQVSGARYKIQNGKAVSVEIGGSGLQMTGNYVVAVSDYLAQGGDNCDMMKDMGYFDTEKLCAMP